MREFLASFILVVSFSCNALVLSESLTALHLLYFCLTGGGGPMTGPSQPSAPSAERVEDHAIHLRWKPPADDGGSKITRYKVRRVQFDAIHSIVLIFIYFSRPMLDRFQMEINCNNQDAIPPDFAFQKIYEGPNKGYTVGGLLSGTKYHFRVQVCCMFFLPSLALYNGSVWFPLIRR